jgi:PAS domain S-box-containing protein
VKKVLLIEDDRLILETTGELLADSGYDVLKAESGPEGIMLAKTQLPDLILCDILMPEMDGHEVCRILQADLSTADIPFIFMSSLSDKMDIREGMQMGADDYITKPAIPKELVKTIQTRLEKFERLIKHKELRYHILFELATDAILLIRPESGEIVDANHSCLKILGYQKEEILKLSAHELFSEGEWEKVLRILDQGKLQDPVSFSETRLNRKDGVSIPVQSSGQIIDIHGISYLLLISRDISDIRGKEIALKESKERYKELVENIGEGIGIVDHNERFTYVNPTASEIFGLPAEKLIGQKLLNFIHPSSHAEILRQTQLRKQGQKGIYEVEVLRLDGQRRWIIVTATPQYDVSGKATGTFGIFRDITNNKIADARIKESEERLRAIVNLTNDYIWEIDPQWRYTYVSSKVYDIMGYRPEEMLGKSPFDFIFPEDLDKTKESVREIVHQYKPLNLITNRAVHRDGHIVYLESSGIPLFDAKGKYTGYRGADRDITLRRSFENQLIIAKEKAEESDRLKSSILANVSHELRTPLNGILGFAEIIKSELKDTDYAIMAENIHSSGRRLMTTLNSLITLSQLVAGKISLSVRPVFLKESLASVLKSYELQALEKNLRLNLEADPTITVNTDEQLLKQLLRQILDNAIKFTEKGSISVDISTGKSKAEGFVTISISDTGIGIDKDYHELVFQEFRQVSEGFGRKYQGSGIGLTICKKIIDLLEGRITLESVPGKGSTFYILLPYHEEADFRTETIPVSKRIPEEMKVKKAELPWVLLVEDNLVNKELTEFFLRKTCRVDYAPDGASAIEKVKAKKYVAILMDINLGYGMNGIEATKEIRKIKGYREVPIIAVTGYTMSGDKDSLIAQGCTHYLSKPFDQASILEIMNSILHNSPE